MGERHLKVMVEPVDGGPLLDGIVFNVDTSIWPWITACVKSSYHKLDINEFRGNRKGLQSSITSGQIDNSVGIRRELVEFRLYHRILTKSIKRNRPCLK